MKAIWKSKALHVIKEAARLMSNDTAMISSAMVCLADATSLYSQERYRDAQKRALDSLEYSGGWATHEGEF